MKERAFERVKSSLHLNFFYDNAIYPAIVTNLSENGMRIDANNCPPFKSNFDVLFPIEGDVLTLPVKVKRLLKRHDDVHAMGVELLNPAEKYLMYVKNLKWESSVMRSSEADPEARIYTCKLCGHITFEQMPTECPICSASIEYFENDPDAIKRPQDPHNLTEFEKKHIPIVNISKTNYTADADGYDITVKVGEIGHTMKIEDHITFIDYYLRSLDIKKRCLGRFSLRCDKIQPSITFYLNDVTSAKLTVISNCTAHGSWMSEIDIHNV